MCYGERIPDLKDLGLGCNVSGDDYVHESIFQNRKPDTESDEPDYTKMAEQMRQSILDTVID